MQIEELLGRGGGKKRVLALGSQKIGTLAHTHGSLAFPGLGFLLGALMEAWNREDFADIGSGQTWAKPRWLMDAPW